MSWRLQPGSRARRQGADRPWHCLLVPGWQRQARRLPAGPRPLPVGNAATVWRSASWLVVVHLLAYPANDGNAAGLRPAFPASHDPRHRDHRPAFSQRAPGQRSCGGV